MTFPNLHSAIKYSIRPNPTEYFQCIDNKTCVNVPTMQGGERFKTLPSVINLTSEHPLAITLANISFHTVIEVTFEAGFGVWICHCWDSSICVITRSYLSFVYPITDWVTEEHYSLFFKLLILCVCVFCLCVRMCVFVWTLCPQEDRGGNWISWNWMYWWFWAVMQVFGIEPGSSGTATSAFKHRAIPQTLVFENHK